MSETKNISPAGIADAEYLRQRQNPKPGDTFYIHLSDILLALRPHALPSPLKILDYGCGGSPYRFLFPSSNYVRADLDGENLDFKISADGGIADCPSAEFDLILSTQVLEHVPSPERYLSECRRLLKSGGKLLLTTHGTYEDHQCPGDYYRWTADGLELILRQSGFKVESIEKLTTGGRSLYFSALRHLAVSGSSNPPSYSFLCRVLNRLSRYFRPLTDRFVDWYFRDCRLVPDTHQGHPIYVALMAEATV